MRVTLAKAVLNSLPTYSMQICWFLQCVCDTLDRVVRNFIWQGTTDRSMHMVGWNKIIKPKQLGGLRICPARLQNTSLLDKLVQSLMQYDDKKLWVSLLEDEYLS